MSLWSQSRISKKCFGRSHSIDDLKPLHDAKTPWSALKFCITPMSWSSAARFTGESRDFTWTQIFGQSNPRVPGAARISAPLSGPGGLTNVVYSLAWRIHSLFAWGRVSWPFGSCAAKSQITPLPRYPRRRCLHQSSRRWFGWCHDSETHLSLSRLGLLGRFGILSCMHRTRRGCPDRSKYVGCWGRTS